ncbi:MAG TPA: serine/threonine-protein kinase [Rhodanobacteraceae bacterium]|nr:serine/threonine-protein kinase [Rhodanobacteraceae bacterium]
MSDSRLSLRELFETACGLAGAERARYLATHGDEAQRKRIERMLDADATPSVVLPKLSAQHAAAAFAESAASWQLPAGSRIGPFELSDLLGEGGSSTVFRAWRSVDGIRQDVALKLLRRGIVSSDAQRQYRRELQALTQLRHGSIARLIEGGITDTGAAYIALELVDGVPITDHARAHGLDLRARLALFLEACRAVDAAHRALIVHRDLKPSNVLVDVEGRVKLLDFGVAKLLAADDETQTRIPAFTPAYASPEQRAGGAITTATDVYGLGLMLCELLTGERIGAAPSRTPSIRAASPTGESALSAAARRLLRGDLENVVMKALAPDPALRYASAGRLADDIERVLDGRPVSAHPPSRWYRTRKFVGRHRGGVATALVLALALLASLGAALWQAGIAHREAGEAHAQAERAEATREFMFGVFKQIDPDENGGQSFTAQSLLDKGEQQLGRVRRNASSEADAAALLGVLSMQLGDLDRASKLVARALPVGADPAAPVDVRARVLIEAALVESEKEAREDARRHAVAGIALMTPSMPGAAEFRARAHAVIAQALIARGDWTGAQALLRDSIASDSVALGADAEPLGEEWLAYGRALARMHDFAHARDAFEHGLASARVAYGPDSVRMAHALNEQSDMLGDAGDFDGAADALREAPRIRQRVAGPANRDTLIVEHNLLAVIEMAGRIDEALPLRMDLLARTRDVAARMHPGDLAYQQGRTGTDLRDMGRFDESIAMYRAALAAFESAFGPDAAASAKTWVGYAAALVLAGRYDEADAALARASAIFARNNASNAFALAQVGIDAGTLLRLRGHPAEAVAMLRSASQAYVHADDRDRDRPVARAELSEAELDAGDPAAAQHDAEAAVAEARAAVPKDHALIAIPLFALARAELAQGRAAEAEAALRDALALRRSLPPGDPRRLEAEVALVQALAMQGRGEEAASERTALDGPLASSTLPYAITLRKRLAEIPAAR